mmetsp:Transcript_79311/g.157088  ORF Transcript_79311/g.157088 Transcript_79311/m.157088 type:complete len:715 (-) Transcript_79311:71-2215(-)
MAALVDQFIQLHLPTQKFLVQHLQSLRQPQTNVERVCLQSDRACLQSDEALAFPRAPVLLISALGLHRAIRRRHRACGALRHVSKCWLRASAGFAVVDAPVQPSVQNLGEDVDDDDDERILALLRPDWSTKQSSAGNSRLKALTGWLKERGCEGLDDVQIAPDFTYGIRLRKTVVEDSTVLKIPRSAWFSVSMDAADPEAELAWQLVTERWRGAASQYQPFLDFLWHLPLDMHPLNWTALEAGWLKASYSASESLWDLQRTTADRIKLLAQRARGSGAEVSPPASLLAESKRLEAELKTALILVESRAVQVEGLPGEAGLAAMVPLLDHFQHDATGEPKVELTTKDDAKGNILSMDALAAGTLEAGTELTHCFEPAGSGLLLVRYGYAPWSAGNEVEDLTQANIYSELPLQVHVAQEELDAKRVSAWPIKLRLLAERADIDLRPGAPRSAKCLRLPQDMLATGRAVPLARFLCYPVRAAVGQSEEEACENLYLRLFEEDVNKVPDTMELLKLEREARDLAGYWCEKQLQPYNDVGDRMTTDVKTMRATKEMPGATSQQGGDTDAGCWIGEVVMAHYKAKGPDGGKVKSKQVREARVLGVDGQNATVQFLSNGVRHQVPCDWVLGPERTKVDDKRLLHLARASLASAMLATEAACLETFYTLCRDMYDCTTKVIEACEGNDEIIIAAAQAEFQIAWEEEQKQLRTQFESTLDARS